MFSKALLHILDHDVLGEMFMDSELTGSDYSALRRAYNKLSQNNDKLTSYEASLVESAVNNFKDWYTSEEQTQIDTDMRRIQRKQQ